MGKRILPAALALALFVGGCYHYRLVPQNVTPATRMPKRMVHSFLWGAFQTNVDDKGVCMGNGVTDVVVTTNFGFILMSALTLGIWVPAQIEYACAADHT
jgi:Bor protein